MLIIVLLLLLTPGSGWTQEAGGEPSAAAGPVIRVVRVADTINPVISRFITDELERAHQEQALAFLLEIDTPGGLDTAMRQIIQAFLGSRLPVIAFVYPAGARAASAGALIVLSADFAAMAPGTNIGAAHPVAIGIGGGDEEKGKDSVMTEKVVQDAAAYARSIARQRGRNLDWAERIVRESVSTPAQEAAELGVIDFVADDETTLLAKLDGRQFRRTGETLTLSTKGATLVFSEMSLRQRILNVIGNPTVAYLLLMLGILGIFFEISNPGAILPGAIGAIAIVLAFFGLQTLPVNFAGVLLILLAVILFLLEIKVTSYGMLTIGGILSLTLGSLMLIDTELPYLQISRAVIAATVAVTSGFILLVLYYVVRVQKTQFASGREGMVGLRGTAVTDIDGEGTVYVHGEYWSAWSREPIGRGEKIEIVQLVEGMKLEVRKFE